MAAGGLFRAFLVVVVVMLIAPEAHAVTLMTIEGTVADAVGRPVDRAYVTDGRQTVRTGTDGRYRLDEESVGNYTIRVFSFAFYGASKTTAPLPGNQTLDFTVEYVLSASVSPSSFNNSPSKTITINALGALPVAGACVSWIDELSGNSVALSPGSVNEYGLRSWTGSWPVPAERDDGAYAYRVEGTNCGPTAIARTARGNVVIDSIGPAVSVVRPEEGGTVPAGSRTIAVKVTDDVWIPNGSPHFAIADLNDATSSSLGLASYDRASTVARSARYLFVEGHAYRATAIATDTAGNESTLSWEFVAGPPAEPAGVMNVAPYADSISCHGGFCTDDPIVMATGRLDVVATAGQGREAAGVVIPITVSEPGTLTIRADIAGVSGEGAYICLHGWTNECRSPVDGIFEHSWEISGSGSVEIRVELYSIEGQTDVASAVVRSVEHVFDP